MIAQILLPCAPLCLWWCWGCHWDGENWQGSTKTPDPPNPTCPRTAPHPRCYQGNNTLLKQIIKRVKLWRPKRNRNPLLKGQERKLIQKQIIPCSKKKCPAEVISQPAFSCPHTEQQWHFLFSTTANKSSFAEQLWETRICKWGMKLWPGQAAQPQLGTAGLIPTLSYKSLLALEMHLAGLQQHSSPAGERFPPGQCVLRTFHHTAPAGALQHHLGWPSMEGRGP